MCEAVEKKLRKSAKYFFTVLTRYNHVKASSESSHRVYFYHAEYLIDKVKVPLIQDNS